MAISYLRTAAHVMAIALGRLDFSVMAIASAGDWSSTRWPSRTRPAKPSTSRRGNTAPACRARWPPAELRPEPLRQAGHLHARTDGCRGHVPCGDQSHPPLEPLVTRAKELREVLLSTARALSKRRLIEAGRLRNMRRASGAVAVGQHLAILAVVLREAWPAIENKAPITLADLDNAELLHAQLIRAKGVRLDEHADIKHARDQL